MKLLYEKWCGREGVPGRFVGDGFKLGESVIIPGIWDCVKEPAVGCMRGVPPVVGLGVACNPYGVPGAESKSGVPDRVNELERVGAAETSVVGGGNPW